MSFTKIAPKEVRARCHGCGLTRDVRAIIGTKVELCRKCRKEYRP